MSNPAAITAAITAVIARPRGRSWEGRYILGYGAPVDLGPLLHRLAHNAYTSNGPEGIADLARTLIDDHASWERIEPDSERLGTCRCHAPQPVAVSELDAQMLRPGLCRTARYAYLLHPEGLHIEVRVNGDWLRLGRASYSRDSSRIRFDLMAERARELREAHAWDTDPLN